MGHTPEEAVSTAGWSGGMACRSNFILGLNDPPRDDGMDEDDEADDDKGVRVP